MLFDENPAQVRVKISLQNRIINPSQLIHATLNSFRIEDDKTAIARINDSLSNLHQARDLRTREAESVLRSKDWT